MFKIKHENSMKLLKTAKGQLNAVIRMIEEEEYCIDISKQLMATIGLLKKANSTILKNHMSSCVKNAAKSDSGNDIDLKIEEIKEIFDYLNKNI